MNSKKINLIILSFVITAMGSLFMFSGCSDTLEGEVNANIAPIVEFVNIPPEGQFFSRNPVVYWNGFDPDGLIDYYRYHIADSATVAAGGGRVAYPETLADNQWTHINVDLEQSDPRTTNVLPLKADTLNPVSNPVAQFIFLQAFDREGLVSITKSRLFNRNDNPPETIILDITKQVPFVNSVFEGGIVTGLRFIWRGTDEKDYDEIGLEAPPFDYEWRLFGPFEDSTLDSIQNTLLETVIVTSDANVLRLGENLIICRTIGTDSVVCDTTLLTATFLATVTSNVDFTVDTILNVDSSLISLKLVDSSFNGVDVWVQNERDTLYNVFKKETSDTTVEKNFIFWIRARDDAFVKDLTPAFVIFPVIDPRYERDVAVIDFTPLTVEGENHTQYTHIDTAKAFWHNTITAWGATRSEDIIFDTSVFTFAEVPDLSQAGKTGIDYMIAPRFPAGIPVKYLLKHKLIILYSESISSSGFITGTVKYPEILSAMDAGINVWATWRNPLAVNATSGNFEFLQASNTYIRYFGVFGMSYSGWFANAFNFRVSPEFMFRNEDFVGTYSINESKWPSLDIDTALMHSRLEWHDVIVPDYAPWIGWRDTIAALPDVNWAARAPGTEVMYLYKSLHGANWLYDYEGAPVGHRLESNYFRSVHFCFTMLSIEAAQAQTISNSVFDWLYKPGLNSSSVQEDRFINAPVKIPMDEAREAYGKRLEDQAAMRSGSGN